MRSTGGQFVIPDPDLIVGKKHYIGPNAFEFDLTRHHEQRNTRVRPVDQKSIVGSTDIGQLA